jgi:hypothetical protein
MPSRRSPQVTPRAARRKPQERYALQRPRTPAGKQNSKMNALKHGGSAAFRALRADNGGDQIPRW